MKCLYLALVPLVALFLLALLVGAWEGYHNCAGHEQCQVTDILGGWHDDTEGHVID